MNVVCCSRDWHFKGKYPLLSGTLQQLSSFELDEEGTG